MAARENEENGDVEQPSPLDHHRGRRDEVIPLPVPEETPPETD